MGLGSRTAAIVAGLGEKSRQACSQANPAEIVTVAIPNSNRRFNHFLLDKDSSPSRGQVSNRGFFLWPDVAFADRTPVFSIRGRSQSFTSRGSTWHTEPTYIYVRSGILNRYKGALKISALPFEALPMSLMWQLISFTRFSGSSHARTAICLNWVSRFPVV
jgi:hypothetical protein